MIKYNYQLRKKREAKKDKIKNVFYWLGLIVLALAVFPFVYAFLFLFLSL